MLTIIHEDIMTMVTHSPSYQTEPTEVAVHTLRKMPSDYIREELDNFQALIHDSEDRRDWAILNAELLARNESVVKFIP